MAFLKGSRTGAAVLLAILLAIPACSKGGIQSVDDLARAAGVHADEIKSAVPASSTWWRSAGLAVDDLARRIDAHSEEVELVVCEILLADVNDVPAASVLVDALREEGIGLVPLSDVIDAHLIASEAKAANMNGLMSYLGFLSGLCDLKGALEGL